ncbi:MAG TPA: cytochrome c [Xanthomonadales bacterium]|nr:cytochrome c [Xanthomonadales bacterium]
MWRKPILLALLLAAGFFWLTRPQTPGSHDLANLTPDVANGELVFHAASCAACHGEDLRGGLELASPFGLFRVPNISPDAETGIGGWTLGEFHNAMQQGVSPAGRHYYPAFPYTSYARMTAQDVADLKAYIDQQTPVQNLVAGHELAFPWNIRRGIGLWKRRYLDPSLRSLLADDADPVLSRGRYLAEGAGHCTECHTARDRFGGILRQRWLAGAPSLDGEGAAPNITPHADGLAAWSLKDITYYLEKGFTPDFDTVGGSMVKVQENLARLPAGDLEALAVYLKSLPPQSNN